MIKVNSKYLSRHLELGPPLKTSKWRKMALRLWKTPVEASVYGLMELDAEPALAYIERIRKEDGGRITLTHFLCKAMAKVLYLHPELNCLLRLGKLYPRKNINIFFQVASDKKGEDLSGIVINSAHRKSLDKIASEMEGKVHSIRRGRDPSFKKIKHLFNLLPPFLIGKAMDAASFFLYTLNLWTPLLGIPKDPYGGLMITNIGSLGTSLAFVPLIPSSRVPLIISMGAVRDCPTVKDGQIKVTKILPLLVTFDHRFIDGVGAFRMQKTLERIFANPAGELEKEPEKS